MSRWSLAIKKLSPAKKAWKSFITKVQPKLQTLLKTSLPKALKATTQRLLNSLRSRLRPVSAARRKSYYNYSSQFYHHNRNRNTTLYKSFAAIHIDELFEPVAAADSASSTATTTTTTKNRNVLRDNMHAEAGTSGGDDIIKKGKIVVEGDNNERSLQKSKSIYSVEDAWNAVVAASPQLRCVDERAEEFIYKVRQDMRLQKENSFEEMLARSS